MARGYPSCSWVRLQLGTRPDRVEHRSNQLAADFAVAVTSAALLPIESAL